MTLFNHSFLKKMKDYREEEAVKLKTQRETQATEFWAYLLAELKDTVLAKKVYDNTLKVFNL